MRKPEPRAGEPELEDAGVVRRAVVGRRHRLELDTGPLEDASRWLERHRSLWEAKFDAVERYLAEEGWPRGDRGGR